MSSNKNVSYLHYMDDWVSFTKTKTTLRKYVKIMNITLKELKFKLALDKTYIGKISKEFDFFGYRFNNLGLISLAKKTVLNFINQATKLYEQNVTHIRISQYIK